ncbi:MAG TPA: VOC family protein [Galbitalea sp.]|jgi:predicted enzyme related to lactoylglutathione lyase|nr:VOC family protein [Galbitalea sp.]
MTITIETVTIDCENPQRVAEFWLAFLDYETIANSTDSIQTADPRGDGPRLLFTPAGGPTTEKNRLHFDLRPDDRDAEVARALALGAQRVDIGQTGDESWVVLADPEGNEFCVLQAQQRPKKLP